VRFCWCENRPWRISFPLFFNSDGVGTAFSGSLLHNSLKMLGDHSKFNDGKKLVLIILKYLRAEFIAIPVTHALLGNGCLHFVSPFAVEIFYRSLPVFQKHCSLSRIIDPVT